MNKITDIYNGKLNVSNPILKNIPKELESSWGCLSFSLDFFLKKIKI